MPLNPSKHEDTFSGTSDSTPDLMTGDVAQKVFGLVERDVGGSYQGRIIGFEHVTFTGSSVAIVRERLMAHVAQLIANGTLVLETDFESVIQLGEIWPIGPQSS